MCNSKVLQFLVLAIYSSTLTLAGSPSGDHVCTRIKKSTITVRESYTEPVIVQTFTWCLQFPPRCLKNRIENRTRYRIKTITKEGKVAECCEGYVLRNDSSGETEADPKCIPFCKSCKNGLCSEPNVCRCAPGYEGDDCTHECPPGLWGTRCIRQCDCASGGSCDPVTGICNCEPGWQGPGCELPCSAGRWGVRCKSTCDCGSEYNACHPETGRCYNEGSGKAEDVLTRNWTQEDPLRTVQVSGLLTDEPSAATSTAETHGATETSVSSSDDDSWTPESESFGDARFSRTTEAPDGNLRQTVSETPTDSDFAESGSTLAAIATESPSTTNIDVSIPFGAMVSRKFPETGSTSTPRLSDRTFYRDEDNDFGSRSSTVGPPHPSYVKTVQKEQVPHIQHDTTVLIVVGSVVSLCLTTLAALMIFYLRSKVFEALPLSIYSGDKSVADQDKENTIRSLKITSTTLPPLPTFVNPVFAANPESALITFDAAELNKHYDNRTGTISIRVSGNIRDLLESHYDKPPPATCCHTTEQNAEHVYDEIPLTTPLCIRKE